jgi:hypothetical protein
MIAWLRHLSWSHATLTLLLALIVLVSLAYFFKALLRPTPDPEPRFWPVADYSARYQEKATWLGDRHLLARPINRRIGI